MTITNAENSLLKALYLIFFLLINLKVRKMAVRAYMLESIENCRLRHSYPLDALSELELQLGDLSH